jgi:hypothetical protein
MHTHIYDIYMYTDIRKAFMHIFAHAHKCMCSAYMHTFPHTHKCMNVFT